jgi:hypothetical protein
MPPRHRRLVAHAGQAVAMIEERTMAGHRVLRLLAEGARSRVWLAPGDLALKALRPSTVAGQAEIEITALHRAAGEHVVELLDVSQSAEQTVLVFPRLPRGSLAELLTARAGLDAGEAVTVLAPLAGCVARMHACGVAHGALMPAAVLFRGDGAPMLTGFGSASLFDAGLPEVALESQPGVAEDRAALARLADGVLSRVTGPRAREAARLAAELREVDAAEVCERLGTDLFELAAARPVSFSHDDEPVVVAGRVVAADPSVAARGPHPDAGDPPDAAAWWRAALESGPLTLVRSAVRERWAVLSPGRRKIVLGLGAGAVVVIVATALTPGSSPSTSMAPAVVESPAPEPSTFVDAAIDGDDPIAALGVLLERREGCFRELSVLCLDAVGEQGSEALEADRAALSAILEQGAEPSELSARGAILTERLGASALITFAPDSDPASVLLLKGEAGWRIRDYLAAAVD